MEKFTPRNIRNLIIYCIYVRNHSHEGTFNAVIDDLERIASLGVDAIWLMPIHPIGKLNKKGSLGCPYSIADYRAVNPEYGSLDDFIQLINKSHGLGMKVLIDVVYNHTSHDSILIQDHPEFYYQDQNGRSYTTVPAWSDVIDLKHPNLELTEYLIESLKFWVTLGVDGFRCDVASIIPLEFWNQARSELGQLNENLIWLAESVHAAFVEHRRQNGLYALSDGELYNAFDITYDYDIWPLFISVIKGQTPVKRLLEIYRFQHAIYPKDFIKMHFVDNHDQERIYSLAGNEDQALAWTAFQAFNDGAWLIYAGLEAGEDHTPSLFDRDPIRWQNYQNQEFIARLCIIKKLTKITEGQLTFIADEPCIQSTWMSATGILYGIFNVIGKDGQIEVSIPDGEYSNEIDGSCVRVVNGKIDAPRIAYIFTAPLLHNQLSISSELLDWE